MLSVGFIIFQLRLFWRFPENEQKASTKENGQNSAYMLIQAFTDVCHKHGFPVFLIDPPLLRTLMSNRSVTAAESCGNVPCHSNCRHLCEECSVITFGVISQLWRIQEGRNDFQNQQFVITEILQDAREELHSKTKIPTHYIFQHVNRCLIHLVIFYHIQNEFYWHGEQNWNQNGNDLEMKLHFGDHEGTYSSLDMIKVKIDGLKLRAPSYPLSFLEQVSESRFILCNQSQADDFYMKNGKPKLTNTAKEFYSSAKELLSLTRHILDEIGIRFWISSGTCLGWFRQCDLIVYSKDVDIGIWIKDYNTQMIPAMQNAGLTLIHRFGKMNDSFELSFSGGDVKLDVFFFYEEHNYMWNGGTQARTGKKFKYMFPKFKLCWTLFLGLKVRVPCETITYIEANYGKNWYQPVTSWDWKKSPPNVRENGEWPEAERAEVIQIYF